MPYRGGLMMENEINTLDTQPQTKESHLNPMTLSVVGVMVGMAVIHKIVVPFIGKTISNFVPAK